MKLGFKISGDFITEHLRNLYLEEDFNKAYRSFVDTFGIEDNSFLISILKGEKCFVGINEFELIDETKDMSEYFEMCEYRYGNIFKFDGEYYKLIGKAKFTIDGEAYERTVDYFLNAKTKYNESVLYKDFSYTFDELRAYYIFDLDLDADIVKLYKNEIYGFKRITYQIPFFIETYSKIDNVSIIDTIIYEEQYNVRKEEIKNLELLTPSTVKAEIIKRSNNKFVDLVYMYNNEEKTLKIPEKPFHLWCISTSHFIDEYSTKYKILHIIEQDELGNIYHCVLPSGMKMLNDSEYHSDWIAGAGLSLNEWYTETANEDSEYYAIESAAYDYMFNFMLKLKKKYNID